MRGVIGRRSVGVGSIPGRNRGGSSQAGEQGREPGHCRRIAAAGSSCAGHAINAALGNVGKTVYYTEPVERLPVGVERTAVSAYDSLRQLTDDMNAGRVDTLLILGGNPAYNAPGDIPFAEALAGSQHRKTGRWRLHKPHRPPGLYQFDETAYRCQWHLPEAHYLESWGDVRAFDGTASIIQPLIAPLLSGPIGDRSDGHAHYAACAISVRELATRSSANTGATAAGKAISTRGGPVAAKGRDRRIRSIPPIHVALSGTCCTQLTSRHDRPVGTAGWRSSSGPIQASGTALFANNGWLQECPKFFTKLVWDNAALISPRRPTRLRQQLRGFGRRHIVIRFRWMGCRWKRRSWCCRACLTTWSRCTWAMAATRRQHARSSRTAARPRLQRLRHCDLAIRPGCDQRRRRRSRPAGSTSLW